MYIKAKALMETVMKTVWGEKKPEEQKDLWLMHYYTGGQGKKCTGEASP